MCEWLCIIICCFFYNDATTTGTYTYCISVYHPDARTYFIDIKNAELKAMKLDALGVAPGVPLNTPPLAAAAKAAGFPVIGDIELFARARPSLPRPPVVAITHTNGQSTTIALIYHMLRQRGVSGLLGGTKTGPASGW